MEQWPSDKVKYCGTVEQWPSGKVKYGRAMAE